MPERVPHLVSRLKRLSHKAMRAVRILRDQGPRELMTVIFTQATVKVSRRKPVMLVAIEDAAAVDWTVPARQLSDPVIVTDGPVKIAWIMSPPGVGSGGHQNLFRFIRFAEEAGHKCTIYLYTADDGPLGMAEINARVRTSTGYTDVDAEIVRYDRVAGVAPATQAIFATGWETAYPAFLDKSTARRFYFVQDFEASFYPLGAESMLAENTYRFGFHGITAGGWLAHRLNRDYGMRTDHFDFAVDKRHYSVTNLERRNEVFFYARPVTARRAFEFGVLALEDFSRRRPDVTINLAGWDVSNWDLPFGFKNYATLDINDLNGLYNRCAAGLVMSLSNMSLLPLELMSSGVAPIVNDGDNNRMVSDNPFIEYVKPSPAAIARRMVEVMERPDVVERSVAMSASVANVNWSDSGRQFLDAFERGMRG